MNCFHFGNLDFVRSDMPQVGVKSLLVNLQHGGIWGKAACFTSPKHVQLSPPPPPPGYNKDNIKADLYAEKDQQTAFL